MPKKSKTTPQPTLFRHDVPKMPEGYYSSGPNPNLRRFVEECATPYNPATDDYNVPPFDQPITTTKATAIYNMHTYWSKKPHDAIQQYVKHYTQPGDLVLDPFSGSGGTSLAALLDGRGAIAIDLSPAATFITKNYCTPVDIGDLENTFFTLRAKVKSEFDWLYGTRCDRCDGRATTTYTVYSYVFKCQRCLEKVPLFDCVEIKSQTTTGKEKKINVCPYCYARGLVEEISTRTERFNSKPVLVSYVCEDGCKPARGERRYNDKSPKKREYFETYDLAKLQEIEQGKLNYWTPKIPMIKGYETTVKRNLERQGVILVDDLFSKRNLWALGLLLNNIRDLRQNQDTFLFEFTSILLKASRMMAHNDDGIGRIQKGTYYIPQIEHDINVWRFMEDTFTDFISAYKNINTINHTDFVISTADAKDLDIGTNSIDYIFTDPPYGGNVQYGELNFVWEAWLNFNTNWHNSEIIVNETRGRTDDDWARMMYQAIDECYRVLKPGRWISLCYHDTSEGTWQLLQDIMTQVGFIPEESHNSLYIETPTKTTNQYFAEKVTKRDLVINFRKPREGEVAAQLLLTGEEDPTSFSEKAKIILREALERYPGAPIDRLYDELVSRMVRKGQFQRHNFDELLRSVAEETGGRWYLLETADQFDETEGKKENAAAAHLETFMVGYLKAHPGEGGVHYSNLFEEYLPIGDKPRRLLQDWLPEYFYKTESGTWRPPVNDEERQVKMSLRLSGELRHIKRFANALGAGVPPAERDRPSNAATLAEWLYQCRRSGLYDLGRVLYERGGLRFDSLSEDLQMQVEEDYQICVKRGSTSEKKPARKKKDQLELL